MLNSLNRYLNTRIPNAKLVLTKIPGTNLSLWLLNEDYPQHALTYEQANALMDAPPYWCFCWASGQVLAQYIFDHPDDVAGKNILDFGCGSGIVGIAAALNGANRVIACDIDPHALAITQANANSNNVKLEMCSSLSDFYQNMNSSEWIVCVADVFYDTDNLNFLTDFCHKFSDVWVSDSRTKPDQLQLLKHVSKHFSNPIPDLDESSQFRHVNMYQKK